MCLLELRNLDLLGKGAGATGLDHLCAPDKIPGAFSFRFFSCLIRGKKPVSTAGVDVLAALVENLRRSIDDEPRRIRRVEIAALVDRDVNLLLFTNLLDDLVLRALRC